jgi:hypothetical protein
VETEEETKEEKKLRTRRDLSNAKIDHLVNPNPT